MLLALAFAGFGQSQEELTPLEKKQLTVLAEPATLFKGFFRVAVRANHTSLDKFLDEDGNRRYYGNYSSQIIGYGLTASYGISDRLMVAGRLPFTYMEFTATNLIESTFLDRQEINKFRRTGHGLSDIEFDAHYQFFQETRTLPAVVGFLTLRLPTGGKNPTDIVSDNEYREPVGAGETKLVFNAYARKVTFPYLYSFGVSYSYSLGGTKALIPGGDNTAFRSGDNILIDGSYGVHLNEWISLSGRALYGMSLEDEFGGVKDGIESRYVQFSPTLAFQIKRLRLIQELSLMAWGSNVPTNPSYLIGILYTL